MHTRSELEIVATLGQIRDCGSYLCLCDDIEQDALWDDWAGVHIQLWAEKNLK